MIGKLIFAHENQFLKQLKKSRVSKGRSPGPCPEKGGVLGAGKTTLRN
jgi:hypothetical protein